jgi:flagellar biosynthesis protein FliP
MLMLLTSVAVPVFFSRHPSARRGRTLTTFVIPVLAVIGLAASLLLVVKNFTLVTGEPGPISTVLALIPAAALIVGICLPRSRFLHAPTETDIAQTASANSAVERWKRLRCTEIRHIFSRDHLLIAASIG